MISEEEKRSQSELSIVVPCYNEESNLSTLFKELAAVLSSVGLRWEVILADDGSTDGTWATICKLHENDPRVKGIRFSRNFGHQNALLGGLAQSKGQAVVTMDADLQHPPEVITKMVDEWQRGAKIVHSIRIDDESVSYFKQTTSRLFYRVFSFLGGVTLEEGMADFRLFDRQVVDDLLQFREQHIFLRGLSQWVGYPTAAVQFQSQKRYSGSSKYTTRKMLGFASSSIMSFSVTPLRLSIFVGIVTALIAFAELIYVVYVRLFTDTAVPGWASVVGVMSLLFGILFVLMGMIGEYIGQVLFEVRNRPRFIISEQIGLPEIQDDRRENLLN